MMIPATPYNTIRCGYRMPLSGHHAIMSAAPTNAIAASEK
jgi:hypothetical protein